MSNENDDLEDERNFEASIENDINNQPVLMIDAANIDIEINNEQELFNPNELRVNDVIDEYIDEDGDDVNEMEDDHPEEDDDEDDDNQFFVDLINESSDTDDYYNTIRPELANYDRQLPASHNYLGGNFEDVTASKVVHEQNELITIPIIALPGAQLLPGQVMPLCIYSTAQINMIKNRLENTTGDSTIGFIIRPELESSNDIIGTLAEIVSSKNEENDENSTGMGLLLKVRGRERFRILKIRRDITGCAIADIKIMPEYALASNPLKQLAPRNTEFILDKYLLNNPPSTYSSGLAERFNTTPHPTWLYRQYDCSYMMSLILKELNEAYDQTQLPPATTIPTDSILFSNWLLNNFPFDDALRLKILKLDCINQRLRFIYSVLKHYSSINCRLCRALLCQKSDVFSMSIHGFMSAYVNPNGHVHETLTVYKVSYKHLIIKNSN
jgi:cereblon